jgi:ribose transport system substrate-binding protein
MTLPPFVNLQPRDPGARSVSGRVDFPCSLSTHFAWPMRKRLLLIILIAAMLAGCSGRSESTASASTASAKAISVGMTVQDLSNQIWSGSCESLKKLVEADGGTMTYVDCRSNASAQIQQLENFISSGVSVIIVHPADRNAVETTLGQARAAGIKVFCWDDDIANSDINWLIDNYALGRVIGEQAAGWINEKLGGAAQVAVLDYPQIQVLLERGKGIVDGIKANAPKARIVAQSAAINPTEGQSKTETILQANPDVKVIACIGGGGAIGANEAVKASGKLTETFGIFAADATPQELAAIANNEACRMSVLITGGPDEIAAEIYGWVKKLAAGEPVEKRIYRTFTPVTKDNLGLYYTSSK